MSSYFIVSNMEVSLFALRAMEISMPTNCGHASMETSTKMADDMLSAPWISQLVANQSNVYIYVTETVAMCP
jgi:hypothetical protein